MSLSCGTRRRARRLENKGTANVAKSSWIGLAFRGSRQISNLSSKSPKEKKDVALKLHKQFGHPEALKKKSVNEAELTDPELVQKIDEVSDNCDTCRRYNRARSRPIVSLSLASDVNDCFALDLKFLSIDGRNS